jgi:hypothetical protein
MLAFQFEHDFTTRSPRAYAHDNRRPVLMSWDTFPRPREVFPKSGGMHFYVNL